MRSIFKFAYLYPAFTIGGMAVLLTHSPTLGVVFTVGTWVLAYVFVKRDVTAGDGT